jgi:predicted transcriptional regulator
MYAQIMTQEENDFFESLLLDKKVNKLKVHDIMSVEEIKVYENDDLQNAKSIMEWEGLKHVCVFNEENKLAGTLHYEDIKHINDKNKTVHELMHTSYHKIYGSLDAEVGKKSVIKEKDHCLPVFENQKIIGILNIEDIFDAKEFN